MQSEELIKVWDLPLRVFHWLLIIGFFAAYLTEDDLLTVHMCRVFGWRFAGISTVVGLYWQ